MKILITGATSGIGAATAELCAKKGYELILTGRRLSRLKELQAKLTLLHPSQSSEAVRIANFDVSSTKEIDDFIRQNESHLLALDVLINSAGLAKGAENAQEGKLGDWEQMINTNILGLFALTRAVLPWMVERRSGHIINMGSVAGRWTYPGGAVYCATKAAVRVFTEGLRMDLLGKNIRVTNIEPGMVETEFSLVRYADQEDGVKKAQSVYEGMKPLTAIDIAETILWTMERPSHINIQELVIYPTEQAHVGQVYRSI